MEYTVYVIFLVGKAPGPKGREEKKRCLHSETFSLNVEAALPLTSSRYQRLITPVHKEVQRWNTENGAFLGTPEVLAIPRYDRITKTAEIAFNLIDRDGWKPIAAELIRLYKQNKKNLRVDIEHKYKRPPAPPALSQQPVPSQPQSLAAGGHIGGRDFAEVPLSTGRRSTTQQQLDSVEAENLTDPTQQGVEELGKQWICDLPSCSNYGAHCW